MTSGGDKVRCSRCRRFVWPWELYEVYGNDVCGGCLEVLVKTGEVTEDEARAAVAR